MMISGCTSCWWRENGRCYVEPVSRLSNGRSIKLAENRCEAYQSKRSVLSQVIPNDMLVIMSEKDGSK